MFATCGLVSSLLFCFDFGGVHSSKKDPPKNRTLQKHKQKCRNKNKTSVSAVVFTNNVPKFSGGGLKNQTFC